MRARYAPRPARPSNGEGKRPGRGRGFEAWRADWEDMDVVMREGQYRPRTVYAARGAMVGRQLLVHLTDVDEQWLVPVPQNAILSIIRREGDKHRIGFRWGPEHGQLTVVEMLPDDDSPEQAPWTVADDRIMKEAEAEAQMHGWQTPPASPTQEAMNRIYGKPH